MYNNPLVLGDVLCLLHRLRADLMAGTVRADMSPAFSPMLEIGSWRGLQNVYLGPNEIAFWASSTMHVRLDCSKMPMAVADEIKIIWMMVDPLLKHSAAIAEAIQNGPDPK